MPNHSLHNVRHCFFWDVWDSDKELNAGMGTVNAGFYDQSPRETCSSESWNTVRGKLELYFILLFLKFNQTT